MHKTMMGRGMVVLDNS